MIQSRGVGVITGGLVFFAVLSIMTNLLRLPFSLYDTFVIEDRYGFNTMTFKMWISDLAKSVAISTVLGGLVLMVPLGSRGPWRDPVVGVGMDLVGSF